MRRHAPLIFALLSALFLVERAVNGGAFSPHPPVVAGLGAGLGAVAPPGPGTDCLPRDQVLVTLAGTGARLTAEPAPFCTDRTDLAAWVLAEAPTGHRHLAFDTQGCLATWHEVPCP